ncbi:HIV Tat-specific factor 1 [Pararge aegeria]|uniref:17S U2 SnRNP complex component HTATSF1 n=3 Tax=Pararge aegeria TaxID=116150 RepID=A0A8S4RAE0_9NEOP|nr:HIV Tat-specific factor 1 [Pararge aegeria]CAH2233166.1 jg18868 [Pararge aegeria aegeria]
MSNSKAIKTGFVIKLSSDTVQKLTEEDHKRKVNIEQSRTHSSEHVSQPDIAEKDKQDVSVQQPKNPKTIEVSMETDNLSSKTNIPFETSKDASATADNLSTTKSVPSNKDTSESVIEKNEDKSDAKSESEWGDYAPYITYDGEEAIYTDPSSHQQYTWNKESNSWDPKAEVPGRTYTYENDTHVYTEADGSKSFWDAEKKAWLPKVDDEFLAYYQMSYGFVDNAPAEPKPEKDEKKKTEAGLKRKAEPQWFQPSEEKNTKVYVSNLPLDITEEEFVNFMQKCGLVERDPRTQKMKVKMYMDKDQNCFKGDALCTYIKIESVDLALKLLDGCDFKGNKITVERALFQMKGEYNPALKPKKKKKKELEKLKKMQQKLFDWRPEKFIGERSKHERIVIVKNLFSPSDFDNEVQLILDYQQDLREECSKCGEVRKVVMYDRHPEGVAQITMKEPEEADAVIQLINGRWFGKKQITAETWDGRTKYRIAETDAALNQRIDKWDKFLEGGEDGKPLASSDTPKTTEDSETKQDLEKIDTVTVNKGGEEGIAVVSSGAPTTTEHSETKPDGEKGDMAIVIKDASTVNVTCT